MRSFLTVASPEEKQYCRKLLPRIIWFKPAKGSHKASLEELEYGYSWQVWDDETCDDAAENDLGEESLKCMHCNPSREDSRFLCDCNLTFYCRDSCKHNEPPPSHDPTCVFLQLQEETVCCAATVDVFESSFGKDYDKKRDVSPLAIRTLTKEARLYGIPWSLLLGTFHCVGGMCEAWNKPIPVEYAETFKRSENMMVEMLQCGYDVTETLHVNCPGNWPQPELQCYYPVVCKQALSRYAHALEDMVSSALLLLMSFQSTVGFDVLPIAFSYIGLNTDVSATVGATTWTCVKDQFKRRRLT